MKCHGGTARRLTAVSSWQVEATADAGRPEEVLRVFAEVGNQAGKGVVLRIDRPDGAGEAAAVTDRKPVSIASYELGKWLGVCDAHTPNREVKVAACACAPR